jgi:hypothetical protein
MTLLGTYTEPHSANPGGAYVLREQVPHGDLTQVVTNQRTLWNKVKGTAISVNPGLSPYIKDNSATGPSPQSVDNTPRNIRDSASNILIMVASATAGDSLIVDVGPLWVQGAAIATDIVYLMATVSHGGTLIKTHLLAFDSTWLGSPPPASLVNFKFVVVAPVTATYSVALLAFVKALPSNVTVSSPGDTHLGNTPTWPMDSGLETVQQWGCITVIGGG